MVIPFVLQFSCRLPVSVCGTGTLQHTLAAFLASVNSSASTLSCPIHHPALRVAYFTTTQPHDLAVVFHPHGLTILLCPCLELCGSTGISTSCPSSTPFGLDLGPDLPWADEPSPGNLRLSTEKFLTSLSLLMPAFSLVCCPPLPFDTASAYIHCSSTNYVTTIPKLRCHVLAPVIFGAPSLDQ